MNVSVNNVSFKARITPDYVKAVNVLREFKNKGIVSPTFQFYRHVIPSRWKEKIEPVVFSKKFFNSEYTIPDREVKLRNMFYSKNSDLTSDSFYSKFLSLVSRKTNGIERMRRVFKNKFKRKFSSEN